ncbi:MAG TPA: XcyI family restriction endonuclease [Gemmataceae bacterium]|nr:XcyI family restriction endonuclease [Gemmataceae bacterium]
MSEASIPVPKASRQVQFHQLLVSARKTWLIDALSKALTRVDQRQLKSQLLKFVPADAQKILAAAGIRDEHVFPTPVLLEAAPALVGYYRLLLGLPQKIFYGGGTGMGPFKNMEMKGTLREQTRALLPAFCKAMNAALADLVRQILPRVTARDISELPLLTLGSFFQGANNVKIGKQATLGVFLLLFELVQSHVSEHTDRKITVRNAAGRIVTLSLGSDPDVSIEEDVSGKIRRKVALEIKGGTDQSNAHNRAGEAEKSHQKARDQGYRDFWTLIAKHGLNMARLTSESPTTRSWFDVAQVLAREGKDWEEFRSRIAEAVGIPLNQISPRGSRK